MRWTDDRLGDAIRALDPAADLPTDPQAEDRVVLAAVVEEGRRRQRFAASGDASRARRRRAIRWAAIPAIAAAAAIALVVAVDAGPHRPLSATAYGPEPLEFLTTGELSVDEVIADAQQGLATGDGPDAPERAAHWAGWYADIQMTGTPKLSAIVPTVSDLVWHEDLSGRLRVTSGQPYAPDGMPLPDPTPTPGTLVHHLDFAPGEFVPRDANVPSTDPAALTTTLDAFANGPETEGAADHILGVDALLQTWTLTDAHQSALLDILAADGDLEVAGTTVDRDGRAVIGLVATSHLTPWTDCYLLLSAETGRIVGVEQIYTGTDQLPIPTNTVIAYTVWETPE